MLRNSLFFPPFLPLPALFLTLLISLCLPFAEPEKQSEMSAVKLRTKQRA
jgi:hypothetical protein